MSHLSLTAYLYISSAISERASTPSFSKRGGSCLQTASQTCAAASSRADRPQGVGAGAPVASITSDRRPPYTDSNRLRARLASRTLPTCRRRRVPTWPRCFGGLDSQKRGSGKSPRACPSHPGIMPIGGVSREGWGGKEACASQRSLWTTPPSILRLSSKGEACASTGALRPNSPPSSPSRRPPGRESLLPFRSRQSCR